MEMVEVAEAMAEITEAAKIIPADQTGGGLTTKNAMCFKHLYIHSIEH